MNGVDNNLNIVPDASVVEIIFATWRRRNHRQIEAQVLLLAYIVGKTSKSWCGTHQIYRLGSLVLYRLNQRFDRYPSHSAFLALHYSEVGKVCRGSFIKLVPRYQIDKTSNLRNDG